MPENLSQRFPDLARELGPKNVAMLMRATTELEVPAGRAIIRDRMPVDSLYMLMQGEVEISVEENRRAISLGVVGPGQWLGEVSVLSGEMLASSTVTAVTNVTLLRIKHQAFEELVMGSDEVAAPLLRQLTAMLTERLRATAQVAAQPINIRKVEAREVQIEEGKSKGWLQSFFGRS